MLTSEQREPSIINHTANGQSHLSQTTSCPWQTMMNNAKAVQAK